jgi:hypothetical protein
LLSECVNGVAYRMNADPPRGRRFLLGRADLLDNWPLNKFMG